MYYRPYRFLPVLVGILTLVVLNTIFIIAAFFVKYPAVYVLFYRQHVVTLNLWWVIFSYVTDVLINKKSVSYNFLVKHQVKFYVLLVALCITYLFFYTALHPLWFYVTCTFLCYGVYLMVNRLLYIKFSQHPVIKKRFTKRVLILGYNSTAKRLVSYLEEEDVNYYIVGFCEDQGNIAELTHYPVVSDMEHAIETSKRLQVSEIFLTLNPEQNNFLHTLAYHAEREGIRVSVVPAFSHFIPKAANLHYIKDMPVFLLKKEPLENAFNRFAKRVIDVVVSTVVIISVLSWLLPVIALVVFLDSPGPVFIEEQKVGKNNKLFKCFAFRTTKLGNDDLLPLPADAGYHAETNVGKFLKKLHINKLAYFLNILCGHMSLVGVQAHPAVSRLQPGGNTVQQYYVRAFIKPGITSWARVNCTTNKLAESESSNMQALELDTWYAENWSLRLDLKIMLLSVTSGFKSLSRVAG